MHEFYRIRNGSRWELGARAESRLFRSVVALTIIDCKHVSRTLVPQFLVMRVRAINTIRPSTNVTSLLMPMPPPLVLSPGGHPERSQELLLGLAEHASSKEFPAGLPQVCSVSPVSRVSPVCLLSLLTSQRSSLTTMLAHTRVDSGWWVISLGAALRRGRRIDRDTGSTVRRGGGARGHEGGGLDDRMGRAVGRIY